MPAKVVVAACRTADGLDLYPDPDWPLLRRALEERGAVVERWSWDDDDAPWERADVVAIRSTWDSVDRPQEYLEWVRSTSALVPICNRPDVVAWNLDKRYLMELERAGLSVVPTRWSLPGDRWQAPDDEFVVKPSISGGGRSTARYGPHEHERARAHVEELHRAGHIVMLQRYLDAIDDGGETKMVFIGGRFSHAIRVGPLLDPGTGVLERPWEKHVDVTVEMASADQRALGDAVTSYVADRFGPVTYARVDVVGDTRPQLLELELIDPVLSLWARPDAARALAVAITALSQHT
jgi:hypothetical protein